MRTQVWGKHGTNAVGLQRATPGLKVKVHFSVILSFLTRNEAITPPRGLAVIKTWQQNTEERVLAAYNQTRYSHCDVLLILEAEAAMQHKKTVGLLRINYSIRLEHD